MFLYLIITIVVVILIYIVYHSRSSLNVDPHGKYVLISGCDSGFGRELSQRLDAQGYHVLAGVLLPESIPILKEKLSFRSDAFHLDITKDDDINSAYNFIRNKTLTLHALVNNAGIDGGSYVDMTSVNVMRRVMNVNFFGHVSMTKKFLPLLINKRGSRVVNICSVAGYIASPGLSAYSPSKYALESFSDCLRREMFPWNLHVSIIEPSYMRTPMNENSITFEQYWQTLCQNVQQRWGEDFLRRRFNKSKRNIFSKYAEDPMKVIHALEHAVSNCQPRIRYRPGWQSSFVFFPLSILPTWIAEYFYHILIHTKQLPQGVYQQTDH